MNISRRWFIGGAAATCAMQGCKVITDPLGLYRGDRPNLKFGVISDVHIIAANTDRGYQGNPRTFIHALKWFDAQGVDAIAIAGDITDAGLVSEMQVVADAWFKVFPYDRSTIDGRKVERFFITGNHDWEGCNYGYDVFGRKSNTLNYDFIRDYTYAKTMDRLFGDSYASVERKNIKGYDFIGAHWDGDAGANWGGMHQIKPWFEKNSKTIDPGKPFFYIQHPHPKNTCFGERTWCPDNGVSTNILSNHPNAVAFSGHTHYSIVDERAIWQGSFTSIGTGSLRYVTEFNGEFKGGFENAGGGDDSQKTCDGYRSPDGRCGILVSVYDDHISYRRRDFRWDADLGPDWVMPLPAAESKPFAYAERAKKFIAPEFSADAKVDAKMGMASCRKNKDKKLPALVVKFPAAVRSFELTPRYYTVEAIAKDGKVLKTKRMLHPNYNLPCGVKEPKELELAFFKTDFPADSEVKVVVKPYESFGHGGKAIESSFVKIV